MRRIGTNNDYFKFAIGDIANRLIPGYIFNDNNGPVFNDLLNYFLGCPGNLDLNKGIALIGDFGVGKSTIMQIFHIFLKNYFPFTENLFRISSIEEIISEMGTKNFMNSILLNNPKSNSDSSFTYKPIHLLINEFGHKYDAKNYGTDVNELIDIFLMKRYDIFQHKGKLLHITSNYDVDDMKEIFHERIIDRFKDMFNIIILKGKSFRGKPLLNNKIGK